METTLRIEGLENVLKDLALNNFMTRSFFENLFQSSDKYLDLFDAINEKVNFLLINIINNLDVHNQIMFESVSQKNDKWLFKPLIFNNNSWNKFFLILIKLFSVKKCRSQPRAISFIKIFWQRLVLLSFRQA
jgi:hypothetical protein